MGSFFGGGGGNSSPTPPVAQAYIPQATQTEQAATARADDNADDNADAKAAAELTRKQRLAQAGRSSTILTGGEGLTGSATTTSKTLLGQ